MKLLGQSMIEDFGEANEQLVSLAAEDAAGQRLSSNNDLAPNTSFGHRASMRRSRAHTSAVNDQIRERMSIRAKKNVERNHQLDKSLSAASQIFGKRDMDAKDPFDKELIKKLKEKQRAYQKEIDGPEASELDS